MIFFLLFLVQQSISTLKRGDDPYKILGVKRSATKDEIKKAYRQIIKKYHPDVANIDKKEAEKIFIRVNDAYELLTDENRKRRYDQTGSVSEEPEMDQSGYHQYSGFPEDIFQFFTSRHQQINFKTDEVTSSNIDKILKENKELFIFVYDGQYLFGTQDYIAFFEEVADELGKLAKLVRNDVSNDRMLAHSCGVGYIPAFVHMKIHDDGSKTTEVERLKSRESLLNWIQKCWSPKFKYFSNANKLKKWMDKNKDFTRVISIERGNEPSMEFKKASSRYLNCRFAVVIDDYIDVIRYLKLTELPSTIVIRAGAKHKLKSYSQLKSFSNPFFFKLNRFSLDRECSRICLLHIGEPSQELISEFTNFTETPVAWTSSSSNFAQSLNIKNGNWILINGKQRKYAKIDIKQKYVEISKFNAKKLAMHPLKCEIDWSFDTLCEKAKDSLISTLKYLNPLKLLNLLPNGFSLEFLFLIITMFFFYSMLGRLIVG